MVQHADSLRFTFASHNQSVNNWFCIIYEKADITLEDLSDPDYPRDQFGDVPIFPELDAKLALALTEKIGSSPNWSLG